MSYELPRTNQTGPGEWLDVELNDLKNKEKIEALGAEFTGGAYRPLLVGQSAILANVEPATRMIGFGGAAGPSTGIAINTLTANEAPAVLHFVAADYAVAGRTQKLRVRCWVAPNATKPTITFTFGLYPVTFTGNANLLHYTFGTVVAGSEKAIVEPAASTFTAAVSADFAVPATGAYALAVTLSAQMTVNSVALVGGQLQSHYV